MVDHQLSPLGSYLLITVSSTSSFLLGSSMVQGRVSTLICGNDRPTRQLSGFETALPTAVCTDTVCTDSSQL
jgi:hypothetical protein